MKYSKIVAPTIVIVLLNLILHGFYLVSIERPVFYYEYLTIPLVFAFLKNRLLRYVMIAGIIISDVVISLTQF